MDDIIKKKFGKKVKDIRKAKGYTQEQLAENIHINTRQMARIEAGESFVTSETIYSLCNFLKISPKLLFDFSLDNKDVENLTIENITKKILKFSENSEKLDFIDLAIEALNDKTALAKLKLIIKGIELSD